MPSTSAPFGQSGQRNHQPQLQGNLDCSELVQNAFVLESDDVFVPYTSVTSPSENLLTQLFQGSLHKDLKPEHI